MAPSAAAGSPAFPAVAAAKASIAPWASSVVPGEPGEQKTMVVLGSAERAGAAASAAVIAAASFQQREGLTR